MGITVSGLEHINLSSLQALPGDFANASSWFGQAEDTYGRQVTDVVASGSAWSGDGQPDALSVAQTNTSAASVGRMEMEAASNAALALHAAMGSAWGKLAVQLDEARRNHVKVHEDGSAEVDASDLNISTQDIPAAAYGASPDADEYWRRDGVRYNVEMEIKGVLAFASIADANVKAMFDIIASRVPTSTATADPTRLDYNLDLTDQAMQDLAWSKSMLQFWEAAQPQRMPDSKSPVITWLKDHASAIGDMILSAGGIVLGGGMVILGASGDVASFALTITGVGALAGAPGMALSSSVIVAGVGTMGVSAGAMNEAMNKMNSSSSGGSSSSNPNPPRYRPGDNKVRSRTYGKSVSDVKGQANNYAKGMEQRGYKVDVPPVRYDKYGSPDVTVAVYKKTGELVAIRHFIVKG
ncbi:MAG TPA: hypothetical protein VF053_01540 [Streptosporangiales bacterium]